MWSDAVITDAGKALLALWAGGGTLNIDGANGGTGTVPSALLKEQTALISDKLSVSIISSESVASGIRLKLQITSVGVLTSFTLNQMGVWASLDGGITTLMALFQDDRGITIPTETEMPDFVFTFYATLQMSNAGSLTVAIDTSALISMSTLTAAIAAHDDDENAHEVLISAISDMISEHADLTSSAHSATPAATPSTLMARDANGNVSIANPTDEDHAANRGYVDTANKLTKLLSVTTASATSNISISLPDVSDYIELILYGENIDAPGGDMLPQLRLNNDSDSHYYVNNATTTYLCGLPQFRGNGIRIKVNLTLSDDGIGAHAIGFLLYGTYGNTHGVGCAYGTYINRSNLTSINISTTSTIAAGAKFTVYGVKS